MGEGFINWRYIVGKKNSILDMTGVSFPMPRLFDYPGDMQSPICQTPMDWLVVLGLRYLNRLAIYLFYLVAYRTYLK